MQTPLEEARKLSEALGSRVLLKREDLQPVFSFKLRGAYNMVRHTRLHACACMGTCGRACVQGQGGMGWCGRMGCRPPFRGAASAGGEDGEGEGQRAWVLCRLWLATQGDLCA